MEDFTVWEAGQDAEIARLSHIRKCCANFAWSLAVGSSCINAEATSEKSRRVCCCVSGYDSLSSHLPRWMPSRQGSETNPTVSVARFVGNGLSEQLKTFA